MMNGKVALVTGGARGMGAAIGRKLASLGVAVMLTYPFEAETAEPVAAEIRQGGGKAQAIMADSGNDAQIRNAVTETVGRFGALDILVNNAGIGIVGPFEELTMDQFDAVIAVNVRGIFVASQEASKYMSAGGRIINTSSVGSFFSRFPGLSLYSMSKAAVEGMTHALARELGPRGITVNATQPGSIDTPMNPADGPYAEAFNGVIPVGRYGHADEVANLVAFLASPEADYINGAVMRIDGGYTS
jgi:3-oxoacyl-[acyl-carrier protein] reductase